MGGLFNAWGFVRRAAAGWAGPAVWWVNPFAPKRRIKRVGAPHPPGSPILSARPLGMASESFADLPSEGTGVEKNPSALQKNS